MKRCIVISILLASLLLATSCTGNRHADQGESFCRENPTYIPWDQSERRISVPGVTFLVPEGEWVPCFSRAESDTVIQISVFYLPVEPAHTFLADAQWLDMSGFFASTPSLQGLPTDQLLEQLTSLVLRERSGVDYEPERFTNLTMEINPAATDDCVRYRAIFDDLGAPGKKGQVLSLEAWGRACLHPNNRQILITVGYSERREAGLEATKQLVSIGEKWISSMTFSKLAESQHEPGSELFAFVSNRSGNYEVYLMEADGSDSIRLTDQAGDADAPAWSPGGKRLLFSSNQTGNFQVYVINRDGTGLINLTNHPGSDDGKPAWSSSGRIAFSSDRTGDREIYVMDSDGSNVQQLTYSPGGDDFPSWSPDSTRIAFHSFRDGNPEVYIMDADGSNQVRLTTSPGLDGDPSWSADGRQLAFTSQRDGESEVYVMNSDGTEQRRITHGGGAGPAWIGNDRIVFVSNRSGSTDIFVMNADGTNVKRLTKNGAADMTPAWTPLTN